VHFGSGFGLGEVCTKRMITIVQRTIFSREIEIRRVEDSSFKIATASHDGIKILLYKSRGKKYVRHCSRGGKNSRVFSPSHSRQTRVVRVRNIISCTVGQVDGHSRTLPIEGVDG